MCWWTVRHCVVFTLCDDLFLQLYNCWFAIRLQNHFRVASFTNALQHFLDNFLVTCALPTYEVAECKLRLPVSANKQLSCITIFLIISNLSIEI